MSTQPSTITMSMQELMIVLKEALISLVPSMEKVRIPWRDSESYDEWDGISEGLFRAIVESSVQETIKNSLPLARYGYERTEYGSASYIGVSSANSTSQRAAFVQFSTQHSPFDSVRVQVLGPDSLEVVGVQTVPVNEARFTLVSNGGKVLEELSQVSFQA